MATRVSTHCGAVETHVGQFGRWAKTHPKIIDFFCLKSMKIDKKSLPKTTFVSTSFLDPFWEGLGPVLGGFGEGFGEVLEGQGAHWVIFAPHFFMLFVAMLPRRALGGFWAPFWLDFEGFGKVWGEFGEGLGRVWGRIR